MALLAIVVILGFGSVFGILCLGLKMQHENKTTKKWVKEYFPDYEKDLAEFDVMRDKLFCSTSSAVFKKPEDFIVPTPLAKIPLRSEIATPVRASPKSTPRILFFNIYFTKALHLNFSYIILT